MGHPSLALTWLESHIVSLGLEISENQWIREFIPDFHDVSIRLRHEEKLLIGHGTSKNPDVALLKALSEVHERVAQIHHSIKSSSGLAASTDLDQAIQKSRLELVERDLFLCHFFLGHPARRIDASEYFKEIPFLDVAIRRLENRGFSTQFFSWQRREETVSQVACLIFPKIESKSSTVAALGSASGFSFSNSIEHSLIEALRDFSGVASGRAFSPLSISDFLALEHWDASAHRRLILDGVYREVLRRKYFSDNLIAERADSISSPGMVANVVELGLPAPWSNSGIKVVKADDSEVQALFIGPTRKSELNMKRLGAFVGRDFDWEEVVTLPHPFA